MHTHTHVYFRADAHRRLRRVIWPSISSQGGLESYCSFEDLLQKYILYSLFYSWNFVENPLFSLEQTGYVWQGPKFGGLCIVYHSNHLGYIYILMSGLLKDVKPTYGRRFGDRAERQPKLRKPRSRCWCEKRGRSELGDGWRKKTWVELWL